MMPFFSCKYCKQLIVTIPVILDTTILHNTCKKEYLQNIIDKRLAEIKLENNK